MALTSETAATSYELGNGEEPPMRKAEGEGKLEEAGMHEATPLNDTRLEMTPMTKSGLVVTQAVLDTINVEQCRDENKAALENLGGTGALLGALGVNPQGGLADDAAVEAARASFGSNEFPEKPMESFFAMFVASFDDRVLQILMVAAVVSTLLGVIPEEERKHGGYIEGIAIWIAIFLVAIVTAMNDYSKELQFRKLERDSASKESTFVLRGGAQHQVNPSELVVGDVVVMTAGAAVPADCVLVVADKVEVDESALTGESERLAKSFESDPFLLSSTSVHGCGKMNDARALVISVGANSQWGKIKAKLDSEQPNTPLQDKLEVMAERIGYGGGGAAVCTFIAVCIRMFISLTPSEYGKTLLDAVIIAVTIVVVAIPEGLPLAVTISLAYSTSKMMEEANLIRVLAACETMGNATNICTDKTGTLTQNRMTVVEGWFAGQKVQQPPADGEIADGATIASLANAGEDASAPWKQIIVDNVAINRASNSYIDFADGAAPKPVGNATECALLNMAYSWKSDPESVLKDRYANRSPAAVVSTIPFNSKLKKAFVATKMRGGSTGEGVRLFCKGAADMILPTCTHALNADGSARPVDAAMRADLEAFLGEMAANALRCLALCHRDFDRPPTAEYPDGEGGVDWAVGAGGEQMCLDCLVGIIDPLRDDVKEAIKTCQKAGVKVRMVTGDHLATARAIATQAGIYNEARGDQVLEGPVFRQMSPKDVDAYIPTLTVLARSSPDDKFLLVTRLNGHGIPKTEEEWLEQAKQRYGDGKSWAADRDKLMPGYYEEWAATRNGGVGEVVGVTGDGTNDAPALKAADVGLAMGIAGTDVAKGSADIVILDDKFSSIVRAINWGRCVYDNIRKFLQFQLTVNVVALSLVFISACAGFSGSPINAVQMLWINLIMDTMGALALGTEMPTPDMLERKPYKRDSNLISWPMARNILTQSFFQLALCLVLLFFAPLSSWGGIWGLGDDDEIQSGQGKYAPCDKYESGKPHKHKYCEQEDYQHYTLIFNAFVFCQVFNEFNARSIGDSVNIFKDLHKNYMFPLIIVITVLLQFVVVIVGGDYTKTVNLSLQEWLVTIAMGGIAFPVGVLMRFIPVKEDPNSFAD